MLKVVAHVYSSLLVMLLKVNTTSINLTSTGGFVPSFPYT